MICHLHHPPHTHYVLLSLGQMQMSRDLPLSTGNKGVDQLSIKIFSKCGIIALLFPLMLSLFCIAGCLERPAESPSSPNSLGESHKLIEEDQENIGYGERDAVPLQLNYDVELSQDLLAVRGDILNSGPLPLASIMLNATLYRGKEVIFYTKYLLMGIEPEGECSFEICKNARILPGEYNCTLEAVGPEGLLASEFRRCSLKSAVSPGGVAPASSGWSENAEKAFWAEIESAAREAKEVTEESRSGVRAEGSLRVEGLGDSSVLQESVQKGANSGDASWESRYVASSSGKKYHRQDCRYALKIKEENRIYFQSSAEAEEKGYLPCKSCNP